MQKQLPPDFSNSEVSTISGVRPSWRRMVVQLRRHAGRDVVSIDHNSVSHKVMGLIGVQEMNSFPTLMQDSQGFGGKRSGENQSRLGIQRAQACVQVIAIRIDQLEGSDRNSHFGHCGRKFSIAAAGAAKTVPRIDAGAVIIPEQIAMAFEVVVWRKARSITRKLRAANHCVKYGHLAITGWMPHAAGNDELSVSCFLADENLIRGEHHVFESWDGIDDMDLAAVLLHYATESFPLGARFRAVHLRLLGHVRIFYIHHIEIIRWTHEHVGHTRDGRRRWRAQATAEGLAVGGECRNLGKVVAQRDCNIENVEPGNEWFLNTREWHSICSFVNSPRSGEI